MRKRHKHLLLLGMLSLTLLMGCQKPSLEPVQSNLHDSNGNFTLHVSNQSFAITPVDILVKIDGEVVLHEHFDVGNQHNWKTFRFSLEPGAHDLEASSTMGEAAHAEEFIVSGDHWACIDYWHYPTTSGGAEPTPRSFRFLIQDTPMTFE